MNIFVTGIGSNSGKTMVSAGISAVMQSLGYNAGVYKPVQIGAIENGKYLVSPDLTFVKLVDPYITTHCTYMLKSETMPLIAASSENVDIDIEEIQKDYKILSSKTDTLIIEATGGLMTPINDGVFSYHIPAVLKLPVVFVVPSTQEAINTFLNEINTAKTAQLNIAGVIINKFDVSSNNKLSQSIPKLIEKYSDSKVLGIIRKFKGTSIHANMLINEILNGIDLEEVFKIKIAKLNSY